jgi:type II secretory pathway component PulF
MSFTDQSERRVSPTYHGVAWKLSPLLPIEASADRQGSLIEILAIAHRQKIPLVPLLTAFAHEHRFWFRRAMLQMASHLESGKTVAQALRNTPGLLPEGTVLAIQSAKTDETLSNVYDSLLKVEEDRQNGASVRAVGIVAYWIMLTIPAIVIFGGILLFILPTITKMFQEFELRLPAPVVLFLSVVNTLTLPVVLLVAFVSFFVLLCWLTPLGTMIRQLLYRWNLGLATNRYRQDLLAGWAVALGSGASLSSLVDEVSTFCRNRSLRKRASEARSQIDKGVDEWTAIGKCGLISSRESQSLRAMPNDQLRSWALLRLTQARQSQSQRRRNTFITVLHPLVIFAFGVFVFGVCITMFMPLTSLIHALS